MLAETYLHRAIANKVKQLATQVEEVSPQQGEHPLTVAPTSVGLRVSAPSTRFKLLKTTNCQLSCHRRRV